MSNNCTNCGRDNDLLESDGGLCARCADNRDIADAQSYRRISRILGVDPADRKAVEEWVKKHEEQDWWQRFDNGEFSGRIGP